MKAKLSRFHLIQTVYFSYFQISQYLIFFDQINIRGSEGNDWVAFHPVCTKEDIIFDPKEFIQFQFRYSQYEMTGYEIKSNFNNWSIFGSLNGVVWVSIHKVTDNFNYNSQKYAVEGFGTFSYLRIQNDDSSKVTLNQFKLYGTMILNDNSINFEQLPTRTNAVLNSQSIYSFCLNQDWGLIDFIWPLSSQDAFTNFSFYCNNSQTNSSIPDLLKNDESSWYSNDELNSKIELRFRNGWQFHPTSMRLKCGSNSFPKSWKLGGENIFSFGSKIPILEFEDENEQHFCSYQEQVFLIQTTKFFQFLTFEQTGPNS